jgi:glutaminase
LPAPLALGHFICSPTHEPRSYTATGEWAYEVGVLAKSGVSGGILAVVPGKPASAFSPGLDVYGNSVRRTGVCFEIATQLGVHVFAAEDEDALLGSGMPASER